MGGREGGTEREGEGERREGEGARVGVKVRKVEGWSK